MLNMRTRHVNAYWVQVVQVLYNRSRFTLMSWFYVTLNEGLHREANINVNLHI